MIHFGVDPGKSGAIAALQDGRFVSWIKGDATERDIHDWLLQFDTQGARAVVERVHASPQMGTVSSFTFGMSYGFLRGMLVAVNVPFLEVTPQKWQKAMGCLTKGDKNVSKSKAQQLWPGVKITHANADAMLIAEYSRLHAWSVETAQC